VDSNSRPLVRVELIARPNTSYSNHPEDFRKSVHFALDAWKQRDTVPHVCIVAAASLIVPRRHNPQQTNAVIVPVASSVADGCRMELMKRYGVISTMEDIPSAGASDITNHTEIEVRQASSA
jgi:hypothetical protein